MKLPRPVEDQGGGRHDDGRRAVLFHRVHALDGGDGLHRLAQAHLIRQDAAHLQVVHHHQPLVAHGLVLLEALHGGRRRLVAEAGHLLRRLVGGAGQPGFLHQVLQVARPEGAQGPAVLRQGRALGQLVLHHGPGQLLPALQPRQVQEFAGPQAEIVLLLVDRAHQRVELLDGALAIQHFQLDAAAAGGHAAAEPGLPGLHVHEVAAHEHLGQALQPRHALVHQVPDALRLVQHRLAVLHVKARVRQAAHDLRLRYRVTVQHDAAGLRREGVDLVAVVQVAHPRLHVRAPAVQVDLRPQLEAAQLGGQLAVQADRHSVVKQGQGGIQELAHRLPPVNVYRAVRIQGRAHAGKQHALLFRQGPHGILPQHVPAVARQRAQLALQGDMGLQLPDAAGNLAHQGQFLRLNARQAGLLLVPVQDEGVPGQQLQHPVQRGVAQGQAPPAVR